MSILTSHGFFSASATRRMIGRPIPKSIPAIASPIMGLDGRATPRMSTSARTQNYGCAVIRHMRIQRLRPLRI